MTNPNIDLREGLPRFDETGGPFALTRQIIDYAWDAPTAKFDADKVGTVCEIASLAVQNHFIADRRKKGLIDADEDTPEVEDTQRRALSRRKTLYLAVMEMLNVVRFKLARQECDTPQEALKEFTDSFWSGWELAATPEEGNWYARTANNASLSQGHSSEDNYALIENIVKSLADAAKQRKKDRYLSHPLQASELPDVLEYMVGVQQPLFEAIQKFHQQQEGRGRV